MLSLSSVPPPEVLATYRDIRRVFGNTEDVLEILALFPSVAELEEAQMWLEGQGDVVARRRCPRTAKIRAILDILDEDEEAESSHTR